MAILYLFTIQNLNIYPIERYYGIISQEIQEQLNEGDTTNFFNKLNSEKDIIKSKIIIPILNDNFRIIMKKLL
jgi:hypothetical protein